MDSQRELGNQALQQEVSGVGSEVEVGFESVRAEALAAVERGVFAVYTEPRAQGRIDHFVKVIESSRLPADRRAALVDKLVGDQDSARAIEATLERMFGGQGVDARASALQALDAAWQGLSASDLSEGTGRGTVGERAEQLIVDLAGEGTAGESVRDFCREVYLIVGWQEEEEEEEELGPDLSVGLE